MKTALILTIIMIAAMMVNGNGYQFDQIKRILNPTSFASNPSCVRCLSDDSKMACTGSSGSYCCDIGDTSANCGGNDRCSNDDAYPGNAKYLTCNLDSIQCGSSSYSLSISESATIEVNGVTDSYICYYEVTSSDNTVLGFDFSASTLENGEVYFYTSRSLAQEYDLLGTLTSTGTTVSSNYFNATGYGSTTFAILVPTSSSITVSLSISPRDHHVSSSTEDDDSDGVIIAVIVIGIIVVLTLIVGIIIFEIYWNKRKNRQQEAKGEVQVATNDQGVEHNDNDDPAANQDESQPINSKLHPDPNNPHMNGSGYAVPASEVNEENQI